MTDSRCAQRLTRLPFKGTAGYCLQVWNVRLLHLCLQWQIGTCSENREQSSRLVRDETRCRFNRADAPARGETFTFLLRGAESRRNINSSDIWKPTLPSDSGIRRMPVAIPTIISVVATSAPAGNIGFPSWSVKRRAIILFFYPKTFTKQNWSGAILSGQKVRYRWLHKHTLTEKL